MNHTTIPYTEAHKLEQQAKRLQDRLELLADYGVSRAEALLQAATDRFNRRMVILHTAMDQKWGAL